jgi:hypothetical protein
LHQTDGSQSLSGVMLGGIAMSPTLDNLVRRYTLSVIFTVPCSAVQVLCVPWLDARLLRRLCSITMCGRSI